MSHARTAIRSAVVTALIAANTLAGARVFTESRDTHFSQSETPLIRVIVESESQQATSMGGGRATRAIERTASVKVTYVCMQASSYVEATDDALELIETAMANLTGSGIKDVTPAGCAFAIDDSGEFPIFSGEQSFDVFYITTQGTPATTL